jgi:septum formation protein
VNPLLPERAQRNLVLASRSPRRIDILRGLEFEFEVVPAHDHVENGAICDDPFERAEVRARLKAADVASRYPKATVIGADTVVIIDGEVLDKPTDDFEALRFLQKLSGREHIVVTGVAVRRESNGFDVSGKESTRLRFRELSNSEMVR